MGLVWIDVDASSDWDGRFRAASSRGWRCRRVGTLDSLFRNIAAYNVAIAGEDFFRSEFSGAVVKARISKNGLQVFRDLRLC